MAPNGEAPAMAAAVAPLLATIIGSFGSGEHRRQQRIPSFHELRSCVAEHDKEVEDGGGHDGDGAATWMTPLPRLRDGGPPAPPRKQRGAAPHRGRGRLGDWAKDDARWGRHSWQTMLR